MQNSTKNSKITIEILNYPLKKGLFKPKMIKTIYLNLEDDVAKVVAKLKREKASEAVLVFPKRSFIFSDSINLRLLKKQIDLLGKQASILTMDERGQMYAQEAGFELKHLPRTLRTQSVSDIRPRTMPVPETVTAVVAEAELERLAPEDDEDAELVPVKPVRKAKKGVNIIEENIVENSSRATARSNNVRPKAKTTVRSAPVVSMKPITSQDNVYLPPSSKVVAAPKKRKSYRAYVVGFIALALVILLLLTLVVLPSASIAVYAKSQTVARDIDIIADTKAQVPDSSKLTIPAVAVNESQTVADTFQVNGKKEVGSKAEGRVALYNLTGQPMALKAGTTTLTVGSKAYVFKADQQNVRALTSASDDGNASVADIVAVDGGEGFNIPAGTRMEITNQAFGSQPQRLYAKTVTQIVGGTSRFISMVSKEDLTQAQNTMIKRLVDDINSRLAGNNVKLVEGAYAVNVESFNSDKPEGTEAQSYSAELKVNITGLAFDEAGLKTMVRQRLLMSLGAGKALQDPSKDTIIYRIKNLDAQNGIMQLALHYESNALPAISVSELKNKIAGKSKQEASDLILANPDVDKVEITVQPAWQSGMPRFSSKINLEVRE